MDNGILGRILKEPRIERGISQETLALMLGISRSSVVQIENGRRKLSARELLELSKVFDMPVEQIIDPAKRPVVDLEESDKEPRKTPQIRINVPQENVAKLKEILLYILRRIGARPNVGETVLYKLLYFMDFDFYEKYEEQLIGARYIKNKYGPTPIAFRKIVEKMLENEEISVVVTKRFRYPQTKYIPLREPDLTILRAHELEIIEDVLCRLGEMNASQISLYSHKDVPWLTAEDGEFLEYESVFYRAPEYSVRDGYDDNEN